MNLPQTQWDLVEGPCHHCVHTAFLLRFHRVSSTSMKILLRPHQVFTRFFPRFCKVVEEHGTMLLGCSGSYHVHTAFLPGSQWVCNSSLFLFWHFYQILIWLSIVIFSSKKKHIKISYFQSICNMERSRLLQQVLLLQGQHTIIDAHAAFLVVRRRRRWQKGASQALCGEKTAIWPVWPAYGRAKNGRRAFV